MAIAENSYSPKLGSSCLQILDKKYGFQVKFQTQKHGTHTPVCKHDKYPFGARPPMANPLSVAVCKDMAIVSGEYLMM